MQIVLAKEHGEIPIEVEDNSRFRRDIIKRGLVTMRTQERTWRRDDTTYDRVPRKLFAGSMVGLLPLSEDVAVLVEPRSPASITHMVNAVGWSPVALDLVRFYQSGEPGTAESWMLEQLAGSFLDSIERVVHQGLLRSYVIRDEDTSSPKGHLRVGDTLRRHNSRGRDFEVAVEFFERTETNPLNQCLLEGVHWVTRWATGVPSRQALRKRALLLLHHLRYVDRDPRRGFRSDRRVREPRLLPASRSAYAEALPIATALLERRGFSLDAAEGLLGLTSLLIKTDDLFEEFVRHRLSELLPDGTLTTINGNRMPLRTLYQRADPAAIPAGVPELPLSRAPIQPDILIEDGSRATRLVIDVKYVPISAYANRDAIDQIVTYAHRLDCSRAVTIHPASSDQQSGLRVAGRVGRTTIYSYLVNAGAADLEAEMSMMAHSLNQLCQRG